MIILADLFNEYKKCLGHKQFDKGLIVPVLNWCSGNEKNIMLCSSVSSKFFVVDDEVLSRSLSLNNCGSMNAYPKTKKDDKEFFLMDLSKFLGITKNELIKMSPYYSPDMEETTTLFGYDKSQNKLLMEDTNGKIRRVTRKGH